MKMKAVAPEVRSGWLPGLREMVGDCGGDKRWYRGIESRGTQVDESG